MLCLKDLWETREKPRPLQLKQILAGEGLALTNGKGGVHALPAGESACKALGITGAHRVFSLAESAKVSLQWQALLKTCMHLLDGKGRKPS